MKKLKASSGNEDSGMVGHMEEALKNRFEEFKGQETTSKLKFRRTSLKILKAKKRLPSFSPFVQLARITQGNN
ncbi:hypothetical protein M9H77_31711 [Catharanthus roseus]|uniref:Uncharacterized protein n=1 Tax=Catharanthus roseus TaxID=4058 RepID=A0ACC0A2X5_CATRO|nr:hypothetical protein M9H77_31711 [Catharanthus roseus]